MVSLWLKGALFFYMSSIALFPGSLRTPGVNREQTDNSFNCKQPDYAIIKTTCITVTLLFVLSESPESKVRVCDLQLNTEIL